MSTRQFCLKGWSWATITGVRSLSHLKATFPGNLEASNCSACYWSTFVTHEQKIEQCLQINKKNICECKHSNVDSFLFLEILACKLPPMKWPNLYSPMVQTPFQTSFGISWLSVVLYPFDTFSLVSVGLSAMHSSSLTFVSDEDISRRKLIDQFQQLVT